MATRVLIGIRDEELNEIVRQGSENPMVWALTGFSMLTVEFSTKCIESAGELTAKGEDLLPRLAELPSTLETLSRRSSRPLRCPRDDSL